MGAAQISITKLGEWQLASDGAKFLMQYITAAFWKYYILYHKKIYMFMLVRHYFESNEKTNVWSFLSTEDKPQVQVWRNSNKEGIEIIYKWVLKLGCQGTFTFCSIEYGTIKYKLEEGRLSGQ